MAKFVFQLEAVLRQRLAVERQKQLIVAGLERERAAIEDEIRGHQRDLTAERADLSGQLAGGGAVDLRGVRMQASAALHTVARAQQSVLRLAGVHRRLDAARLDLLAATTRRRAVEVLRERRHEEWRSAQKRQESAAADELAVMAASRREIES